MSDLKAAAPDVTMQFANVGATDQLWSRTLLVGLVCGALIAVLLLMRRGWLNRAKSQRQLRQPLFVDPHQAGRDRWRQHSGRYLGTTRSGDWLDRVVIHDLGTPSAAVVCVGDAGVSIERRGAASYFLPWEDIVGARLDRAACGKVFERDGIVIVTWGLATMDGDTAALDTALRLADVSEHADLVAALNRRLALQDVGGGGPRRPRGSSR